MVSTATIESYSNARKAYDDLCKIDPKNELLKYVKPEDDHGLIIKVDHKSDFRRMFRKTKGDSDEENLAIQMRNYKIVLEKELTILGQKRRISEETSHLVKGLIQR